MTYATDGVAAAGDPERWRAAFVDDGPEDVLKFWCPVCWLREFE